MTLKQAVPRRGLYYLMLGNEVVYVGQSKNNILLRIGQHVKADDKQFDGWAFEELDCNDFELDHAEAQAIRKLRPKHNIIFNTDWQPEEQAESIRAKRSERAKRYAHKLLSGRIAYFRS